jgi:hypothetical protein
MKGRGSKIKYQIYKTLKENDLKITTRKLNGGKCIYKFDVNDNPNMTYNFLNLLLRLITTY